MKEEKRQKKEKNAKGARDTRWAANGVREVPVWSTRAEMLLPIR